MLRFKQSSPCWEYVVPVMACGQVAPYFVASSTSPFFSFLTSLGAFQLHGSSATAKAIYHYSYVPVLSTGCLRKWNA
jgi:hypothetical protein